MLTTQSVALCHYEGTRLVRHELPSVLEAMFAFTVVSNDLNARSDAVGLWH
jgi:hypothetical protein